MIFPQFRSAAFQRVRVVDSDLDYTNIAMDRAKALILEYKHTHQGAPRAYMEAAAALRWRTSW